MMVMMSVSRCVPTHHVQPATLNLVSRHHISSTSLLTVSLATGECRTVMENTVWHMDGLHLPRLPLHLE